MPRKPRVHYEGALYHVICRGNNREFIFKDNKWKTEYLEIVKKYKERYKFKLYAYVVMDNHVHMLIEVDKNPLSKIMQGIQQVFTQRYNLTNKRSGHIFEQRYKAILCDKDEYLLMLIRYIHQNPIRIFDDSGLRYPYSSYIEYLKKESIIIDREFPMSLFDNNIKRYVEFMEEEEEIIKELNVNDLAPVVQYTPDKEHQRQEYNLSLEKAIEKVAEYYNLEIEDIKSRTQNRKIVKARRAIIYILENNEDVTNKELANSLNISQSSISVVLSDKSLRDNMMGELENIVNL